MTGATLMASIIIFDARWSARGVILRFAIKTDGFIPTFSLVSIYRTAEYEAPVNSMPDARGKFG
jgi:hypothetical protein